jgi:hypothetical protein
MDTIKKLVLFCVAVCVFVFTAAASAVGTTLLTQKMLDQAGATFVVKKNYTANGAKLNLANKQKLVFEGGMIDDAELVGNHSTVKVSSKKPVFGKKVVISGIWDVKEAHDGWFVYEKGKGFLSNQLIQNMLAFSNDKTFCHLFFEEDRVYYFEHPYKGNAKLGDKFTYHFDKEGNKKRHYKEVYNDEYSFLRIFIIPSNTKITLNNTWQMLPTGLGAYFVFWEYGKENVTIEGKGTIAGDNKEHLYTTPYAGSKYFGEWGFIFRCFKCKNFVFRGITIRDAFGDCLIFQGSHLATEKGSRYADGLLVENVKIIGARRNGIAIGARNVVIRNCHFEDCGIKSVRGTPPRCAIDFEPDGVKQYPEIGNQNVLMEKCTFKNNYYDVGSYRNNLENYGKIATTIKNCKFTAPVKIQGTYWMRFENCYIPFVWNNKDDRSVLLYSKHMEFINCEFGQLDTTMLGLATRVHNTYSHCKYNTKKK